MVHELDGHANAVGDHGVVEVAMMSA